MSVTGMSASNGLMSKRDSWIAMGVADLAKGIDNWRVSYLMGLNEVRKRYARSKIGQFWVTISTSIMVISLGVVWSMLWKVEIGQLLPYIAISMIVWTMITGTLADAAHVFVTTGPIFLNQGMSFSTAIYALVYRHILIFLHNLPIIVAAMLLFSVPVGLTVFLAIPGFVLLAMALLWTSYVVGIICVRFRDVTQLVQSALMMAFFITPVLWKPDQIPPDQHYLLSLNPFAALLAVVREPLLGQFPTLDDWAGAVIFSFGGFIISLPIIGYCQRRIIYWI